MKFWSFLVLVVSGGIVLFFAWRFYMAGLFGVPILLIEPNPLIAFPEAIILTVFGLGTIIYAIRRCAK